MLTALSALLLVSQHHPDVRKGEDLVAHAQFLRIQVCGSVSAAMCPWAGWGCCNLKPNSKIEQGDAAERRSHPAAVCFNQPQEAYELIMGKRAGKDVDGRPTAKSDWDFFDCECTLYLRHSCCMVLPVHGSKMLRAVYSSAMLPSSWRVAPIACTVLMAPPPPPPPAHLQGSGASR